LRVAAAKAALFGTLLLTSACSHQAQIPTIDGLALAQQTGAKQPGRYAAFIQNGGWALSVDKRSFACSLNRFDVDINPTWEKTAKEALTGAVRDVDFVTGLKSAQELKNEGYDALVTVMQSNAKAEIAVLPKLLRSEAIAETSVDLMMVVTWSNGDMVQQALAGQGRTTRLVYGCDEASEVVGQSASRAVRAVVKEMVVALKQHLVQHKD
jgi:hypothetical protein